MFEVRTAIYEGPLDLLLQLVTRQQLDIGRISLVDLVGEYLAHIEQMRLLDLEVTSEFLLIAATLIQLKARHLLPDDADLDLDEELALMEERDRLLFRLLACVTFKDVAAVLGHRWQAANRYVARDAGLDKEIRIQPPDFKIPMDPTGLRDLAVRVMTRQGGEPDLDHLDLELPSVEMAIEELRVRVAEAAEMTFEDLVAHCSRKVEVVAYFLALLELARWGMVAVAQEDWLSTITIRHLTGGARMDSEWTV